MKKLHEAHPAFNEPACQQAVVRKRGFTGVCTIRQVGGFGFRVDIHGLRYRHLHPERHLVLGDARQCLRVAHCFMFHPVEGVDGFDGLFANLPVDAGGI